jgi:hypothetical protein
MSGVKVFTPDELVYAAHARCLCGAGLAYVRDREVRKGNTGDKWVCSEILTNDVKVRVLNDGNFFGGGIIETEDGKQHNQSYPFVSYEIKSELQPSQMGATTRPA